jgi:hypothetical protein
MIDTQQVSEKMTCKLLARMSKLMAMSKTTKLSLVNIKNVYNNLV